MNLNLHHSVVPLGDESSKFEIVPSDTIYYNHYAYKIVFDSSNYASNHSFIEEFNEFADSNLNSNWRLIRGKKKDNSLYCYLKSFDDYEFTTTVYNSIITSVYGPVNTEHLNLLTSREYAVEVRKSLWFNRYDGKIYIFLPYRAAYGISQEVRKAKYKEILAMIEENMPAYSYKHLYDGSSDIYVSLDDFNKFYPFLKMMYNDWVIRITKCMLY